MTPTWYSSRRVGETCSGFKTLIEEGTDRILGARLLGGQAEEGSISLQWRCARDARRRSQAFDIFISDARLGGAIHVVEASVDGQCRVARIEH